MWTFCRNCSHCDVKIPALVFHTNISLLKIPDICPSTFLLYRTEVGKKIISFFNETVSDLKVSGFGSFLIHPAEINILSSAPLFMDEYFGAKRALGF